MACNAGDKAHRQNAASQADLTADLCLIYKRLVIYRPSMAA